VRVGGARPLPFTLFTITYKVAVYTVKKLFDIPVPSRDVNYGTGISKSFFYGVRSGQIHSPYFISIYPYMYYVLTL